MLKTLTLTFDLSMKPQHIFDFRGAFIDLVRSSTLTKEEKELFSNREAEVDGSKGKPIERYPLIHYRWHDGHAVIWAMNEGAKALRAMERGGFLPAFTLQNKPYPLAIIKDAEKEIAGLTISKKVEYEYLLFHFIPFSVEKEKEYHLLPTYIEKVKMMEQIILNELVLFNYATGQSTHDEIKVEIVDIILKSQASYKTKNNKGAYTTLKPLSYFMKIRTNIILPDGIAIGRHKAYGYGIISPVA